MVYYFSHESPLIAAVSKGYTDIVQKLLSFPEIDVNYQYRYKTPLLTAIRNRKVDIVRLLLQHPKIDVNKVINYLVLKSIFFHVFVFKFNVFNMGIEI